MALFRTSLGARIDEACAYAPLFLLGALVLLTAVHPQLPTDDALRHIVSYAWGYSHAAMYPQSTLTLFNQYPLFDRAVGALSQGVGFFAALKLMQVAALLSVVVVLQRAAARFLPESPQRPLDATLLTLLILCAGLFERTMLARPEVFVMAWAAAWIGSHSKALAWQMLLLAAGFAVSACYWLAWLSWPLLWMAPLSTRRRLLYLSLLAGWHAAFWHVHTDGAYWQLLTTLTTWNANRLFSVDENLSLMHLFATPAFIVAAGLAVAGWQDRATQWRAGALALLPYLVLNMRRYVGSVLICVLPLMATGWQRLNLPLGAKAVLGPVLVVLALKGIFTEEAPTFKLPEGAVVLTTSNQATFALPMANPGTVSTLPAMEVGASSVRVQKQAAALSESVVDCHELHDLGVTHLVEKSWVGRPKNCMALMETKGIWRLWEVR